MAVGGDVPDQYRDLTLESFMTEAGDDPEKRAALIGAMEYSKAGSTPTPDGRKSSIFLFGKTGVGKTGLLTPIYQMRKSGYRSYLWISLLRLANQVRDGFRTGDAYQKIGMASEVEFLFLDEVGDPEREGRATDGMREVLQSIIYARHERRLPTLMTSNLSPDRAQIQFSEPIWQRIAQISAVIRMDGRVMRKL